MNYWSGIMNWPVKEGWKCETCGEDAGLTWGLVHAQCRCDRCHTQYSMRDGNNEVTDTPISQLKEEYKLPARTGWLMYKTPMTEWFDDMWDRAIEATKSEVQP